MSKFEDFYTTSLITEKVSKKEINEALKNHNIIIGVEFEFILNDYDSSNEEYENAYKAWEQLKKDVMRARKQYEELQDEMYDMYKEKEDMELKRDDIDDELTDANSDYFEAKHQYKKIEKKPEEYFAKFKTTKEIQLASAERELEIHNNRTNVLDAKLNLANDEIDEKEKEYDDKQETYLDEIDWPTMGDDYISYMENYWGIPSEDIDVFLIVVEGQDLPPEPQSMQGGNNADSLESFMESNGIMNDAPFTKYEFGEYGDVSQSVGSNKWAIEPDDSLSEGGVEVKSPPMTLPQFMKIFPKMLTWIGDHGYTNNSTGMHVHLSIKGVKNLQGKINPLKMILFMDEGYIWNSFNDRMNNSYVQSVKDKLKGNSNLSDKDLQKIFDKKKLLFKLSTSHFDAINFENISQGHIEYRYLGGNNYENKEKELTASIAHFAYNLSLGVDESFKKKEYVLKLQRIFNKMALYTKEIYIDELESLMGTDSWNGLDSKDQILLNKLLKEWKNNHKALKSAYKLDNKTRVLLRNNKEFMYSITDDWKKEIKKKISLPGFTNLML